MKEIDFSDIAIIRGHEIFYSCPVCGGNVPRDDPDCPHCRNMFNRAINQNGYPEGYDEYTYKLEIWQKRRVIHRDYKLGKYDKAERDKRMQELLEYAVEKEEQRKKVCREEYARKQKHLEEQRRIYEDLD